MGKKEILVIFLLAVLVTKLSFESPFNELVMFHLPFSLVMRLLFPLFLVSTSGPVFEGGSLAEVVIERFLPFLFFLLLFLFWFLVLAVGWWVVKWLRRKRG